MAVLVTGGAGYIGSHTVAELMAAGESIVIVDNLEKGHLRAIPNGCKFYKIDLHNAEELKNVFSENDIDTVIHFAAYSLVGESVLNPLKYYDNNVGCTRILLECMKEADVKRIVFSSTAATYGEPESCPILEKSPTIPANPYGETKLAIEKMLKWCEAAYGLKHISLRYFNAAGAHTSMDLGEDHNPETHLIPIILKSALEKGKPLFINGDDYPTPDGTCVRDYVHVCDLAQAHVKALYALRAGADSGVFNLGNGNGFSVSQVLDVAREVTGMPLPSKVGPRRAGDPATLVASGERAKTILGWAPQYQSLTDMVESAWKFMLKHPSGYES